MQAPSPRQPSGMQPPWRSAPTPRGKCCCSQPRTRMSLHGTAVTDGPDIGAWRDAARVRDRRGPRSARRRLECAVGRSEQSGVLSGRQHWSARACSPARAETRAAPSTPGVHGATGTAFQKKCLTHQRDSSATALMALLCLRRTGLGVAVGAAMPQACTQCIVRLRQAKRWGLHNT